MEKFSVNKAIDSIAALLDILDDKGIVTKEELSKKIILNYKQEENYKDYIAKSELINYENKTLPPLEEAERSLIISTLNRLHGNKSETARQLKITRRTLLNKLKKYSEL